MIIENNKVRPVSAHQMLRRFTLTTLIATIIAVILLTLLFREMFVREIITIGERNNLVLTKTALNEVKPGLLAYLETVKAHTGANQPIPPLPAKLKNEMIEAMDDIDATRIFIYNQHGTIIYSTIPDMIGRNMSNNPRFIAALNGRVDSKLFYHDHLNFLETEDKDENLVVTSLPIRDHHASTISGVIEIYTDVSDMVSQAEYARLITILGALVIMFLLYSFQVFTVRRATRVIDQQQQTLRERSRTLEVLSAQLMNADETDRQRIANDLHEGVAQTLSAAKLYLEQANQLQAKNTEQSDSGTTQMTIEILQDAIQEIRGLAMELRPTTLDEYGLVKTIDWLGRQFCELHRNTQLESHIDIDDDDVPKALEIILYRVIKESLASIGKHGQASRVVLRVFREDNNLTLMIEDNAVAYHSTQEDLQSEQQVALATIRERVMLTGGTFKLSSNRQGGSAIIGVWPC